MQELISQINIDTSLLFKGSLFFLSGILGMLYIYIRKWSFEDKDIKLFTYLFGDGHAIGRAITTFIAVCIGAGGIGALQSMDLLTLFSTAFMFGVFIPEKIEASKKDQESKRELPKIITGDNKNVQNK